MALSGVDQSTLEREPVDRKYMAEAVALAKRGLYTTRPNPRVGCVLVRDGNIIGRGWHQFAGQGHAEVNAIADAQQYGQSTLGATAYVTLEPCSHTGRTPPCCEGLAKAGVARVVYGMKDPNPLVAGRGLDYLQAQNIAVSGPLLEGECQALNPGFTKRMSQGLPYVRLKQAMSVDGRTAMASGESQWITGPQARAAVQRLRARSCAVVTGVDSVLQDDSRLTVREDQLGLEDAKLAALVVKQQPLRVILDSWLRLPATASILQQPGETLVMTLSVDPSATAELQAAGATVVEMPASNGHVDLSAVLKWLAEQRQVNEVLVETGSVLAGAFIESDLVDELQIFMAPVLMGSEARPLVALPIAAMAEKRALQIDDIRAVGLDWLITARPK